jgi:ribosomal protein S16
MTREQRKLLKRLSALAEQDAELKHLAGKLWGASTAFILYPELWEDALQVARKSCSEDLEILTEIAARTAPLGSSSFDRRLDPAVLAKPVAIVNEGDDGLFIEILYGEDGSPLKLGDSLYMQPAQPSFAFKLEVGAPVTDSAYQQWGWNNLRSTLDSDRWANHDNGNFAGFFAHGWHYREQLERQRKAENETQEEANFTAWWFSTGKRLTEHELGLEDLMQASYAGGRTKGQQEAERLQAELEKARQQIEVMEKALLDIRRNSNDLEASGEATQALHEAALIAPAPAAPAVPAFTVSIERMEESHRVTHWVTLKNASRPADAKPWDKVGLKTPFKHENLEFAQDVALSWAGFLGVEVQQDKPENQDE